MNDLIPIRERTINGAEPVPTVNARELHAFLEAGRDFSNWIKDRIASYGFVEGRDYTTEVSAETGEKGGRPRIDYHLTLDMAKELAMVERNERGKQARLYFIECERRLKATTADPIAVLLADPRKMLAAIEDYGKRIIQLEAKVAEDAPKVETYDAIMDASGLYTRTAADQGGRGQHLPPSDMPRICARIAPQAGQRP